MRVKHDGKIYEFDPNEQGKTSLLDLIAKNLPLPRNWKLWLATKSTIMKGIKVTEVTDDNSI